MSVLSVAPISYENSITKKELPLNIFQGKFPIAIKREVSIRIYKIKQADEFWAQHSRGGNKVKLTVHMGKDSFIEVIKEKPNSR